MSDPRIVTHVSDEEFACWQLDRQTRIALARDQERASGPCRRPAIAVLLAALRQWRPDSWSETRNPNRWRSRCPSCNEDRAVRIAAHADGSATAWCLSDRRCSQDKIVTALKEHLAGHDCDEARFWRKCALDGLDLLHKMQDLADGLLDELAARETQPELEEAA